MHVSSRGVGVFILLRYDYPGVLTDVRFLSSRHTTSTLSQSKIGDRATERAPLTERPTGLEDAGRRRRPDAGPRDTRAAARMSSQDALRPTNSLVGPMLTDLYQITM